MCRDFASVGDKFPLRNGKHRVEFDISLVTRTKEPDRRGRQPLTSK